MRLLILLKIEVTLLIISVRDFISGGYNKKLVEAYTEKRKEVGKNIDVMV